MKQFALSTYDNDFNPFDDFDNWHSFDKEKGYDSCEKLARLANLTDEMSIAEEEKAKEEAIDRFIAVDFSNVYIKVSKELHIPTDDEVKD